jgi:hypothetical protein
MDPRASVDAVEKRKLLLHLAGIEPWLSCSGSYCSKNYRECVLRIVFEAPCTVTYLDAHEPAY